MRCLSYARGSTSATRMLPADHSSHVARVSALLVCVVALLGPAASAQQEAPRQREPAAPRSEAESEFELEEDLRLQERERDIDGDRRNRERRGDIQVAPRPWRQSPRQLTLGVYASPVEVGYRIDGVLRGSPAARVGLEPGDRIITVDGFQVGRVGREFYPLGRELQARGRDDLEVLLLVQNTRNRRLVNLDVSFRSPRVRDPFFRDRRFSDERPGSQEPGARAVEPPQDGLDDAEVQGERTGELQ